MRRRSRATSSGRWEANELILKTVDNAIRQRIERRKAQLPLCKDWWHDGKTTTTTTTTTVHSNNIRNSNI